MEITIEKHLSDIDSELVFDVDHKFELTLEVDLNDYDIYYISHNGPVSDEVVKNYVKTDMQLFDDAYDIAWYTRESKKTGFDLYHYN